MYNFSSLSLSLSGCISYLSYENCLTPYHCQEERAGSLEAIALQEEERIAGAISLSVKADGERGRGGEQQLRPLDPRNFFKHFLSQADLQRRWVCLSLSLSS